MLGEVEEVCLCDEMLPAGKKVIKGLWNKRHIIIKYLLYNKKCIYLSGDPWA